MSSNHTRMSKREWNQLQQEVNSGEASIKHTKEEIAQIQNQIQNIIAQAEVERVAARNLVTAAANALQANFASSLTAVGAGLSGALGASAADFSHELNDLRSAVAAAGARVSSLGARIDSFATAYQQAIDAEIRSNISARDQAHSAMSAVDALIAQIETLNPGQFVAPEYAGLTALRAVMASNMDSGDYEAALASAQMGILNASRTLTRLILLNDEFNALRERARTLAADINARILDLSAAGTTISVPYRGSDLELDYDISHWTRGLFDVVRSDFDRLNGEISTAHNAQQLESIISALNTCADNLTRVDRMGRSDRAGEVIVEDVAVTLNNALTEIGRDLEGSGFHNDDMRDPYHMTYSDGAGNTISVVIAPVNPEHPMISVEAFGSDPNVVADLKNGLLSELQNRGIDLLRVSQSNDCSQNTDPEAFIGRITAEAVREIVATRK